MINTKISRSDPTFLVSCSQYLAKAGWHRDGDIENLLSIWHRSEADAQEWEVLLPEVVELSDYDRQIDEVLEQLASYERRSLKEVEEQLCTYFFDSISIRVIHDDVSDGSIPLIGGVMLNQTASDLMASVAQASINRRRNFTGKRPSEVNEYLSELRLGQTEVGSYVVKVLAPIHFETKDQADLAETSFGSIVTNTLTRSLSALHQSIDKYLKNGGLRVFDEAVASGASANLCDALIGISGERGRRDFAITVSSSHLHKDRPLQKNTFMFNATHTDALKKAAEYFRDYFVIESFTVQGIVKKLDRDPSNELGTIAVQASVYGIDRLVEIELPTPEDYVLAIAAHQEKTFVRCSGILNVAKRTRLLEPSGFRVLKQGELNQDD